MKTFQFAAVLALAGTAALGQDAPRFFAETYPSHALGPAMQWYGSLGGEGAELDSATRELVMLGAAAQIPCDYCVYAHAKNARAAGATEAQIKEAVAAAAAVRMWSTVLNGMSYDYTAFTEEIDQMHGGQ
ncbi:carboxymuconolactone decarboxylase family protein [Limimaricola soesokkakensis]|uniref:carboxymuconolactone decarboxylase family protein n=1 Tax=Limimaricola soesokkakensis TaxID=1343159 RepID=UPI0035193249